MIRIELTFRNLLLLLALLLFGYFVYLVRDTVVLLGLAVMVMATLHPLVVRLERRGFSHSWAVAVAMLTLVLAPVLLIAALSPLIISEVQSFAASVPTLQHRITDILQHWGVADRVNQAIDQAHLQSNLTNLAVVSVQQSVNIVLKAFTVFVIAGYMLADSKRLQLVLHEFVPRSSERHIEPLLQGMERVVGGYIRGQVITSALFGVFAFVLLLVLRVPDPLLLGVVAAIGDIIPIFGVPAAMIVTVLVAFTSSVWQPVAVVGGYTVYQQLEGHWLMPRIYSRTVNLSPLVVIIATIVGGALDGLRGILIGIPIAGSLKVILDYIVAERLASREAARVPLSPLATEQEQQAEEEFGDESSSEPSVRAEDIPEPTYSPFESVPVAHPVSNPSHSTQMRLLVRARGHARRVGQSIAGGRFRGRVPDAPAGATHAVHPRVTTHGSDTHAGGESAGPATPSEESPVRR